MAPLTPEQLRRREQFEGVIRVMVPVLNAVLAAGERLSRLVEREDADYYPPRPREEPPESPGRPTGP